METKNLKAKQLGDVKQRMLKVTILNFQSSASPGIWERFFGNSVMALSIKCDAAIGPNEYTTNSFKCDTISTINESFVFLLEKENEEEENLGSQIIALEVTLFRGYKVNGKENIDVTKHSKNEPHKLEIRFGQKLKLTVEVEHAIKETYDFRYSFHPCEKELVCLKRRQERVFLHLKNLLKEDGPTTIEEVPTVALLCSGGGYRATIQFCGAMEALQDGGVLDAISYISGLSGGAWYLITSYAKESLGRKDDMIKLHSSIKDAVKFNMAWQSITDIQNLIKCWKHTEKKAQEKQPLSFVDFYGHRLGKNLLGSELETKKISDLAPYVDTGRVPIPIVTAIHVRSDVSTSEFYNDLEITPWEVSMPNFGINMSSDMFGSEWYCGRLIRKCSEYPLHFILGLSSNAFGILFEYLIDGETTEVESKFVEQVRKHEIGRHSTKRFQNLKKRMSFKKRTNKRESNAASSSPVNDTQDARQKDGLRNEADVTSSSSSRNNNSGGKIPLSGIKSLEIHNTGESSSNVLSLAGCDSDEDGNGAGGMQTMLYSFWKKVKKHSIFTDREAIIDRTAKVLNCLKGFDGIPYFTFSGEQISPRKAYCESLEKCLEEDNMSFMDAAVVCNIPTNAVLRSQRNADILIVCDATESESDQVIEYFELFNAEKKAREQGLKFPYIDKKMLEAGPRNEIHVFKDEEDPECPVVIWINLCNKSYRGLKNVIPPAQRPGEESYELPEHDRFNDFSVFGPGSVYQTTRLRYSSLQFDRLRELMRYNVEKNIEAIKKEISKKILQRREKLHLTTTS